MKKMTDEMIAQAAERLRSLADPARIRIMIRLRSGECNVGQLAADLGIAQPSVSKHLAVLRQAGIIAIRREGQQSLCSIRDASVFEICDVVCAGVRRHHEETSRLLGLAPKAGATTPRENRH
ncbi:MAG: metalloregulator ArsR/SmtB family transcription factor [Candidatus Sumerlaeaceae bacterium]|nr:metalloregulator ArsR/SmtB family transcription factor [Candidatus Sumerlaeaceae bacterium]